MKLSQIQKQKRLIKEGQIWQLGKHRLLVGDCLDSVLVGELCKGLSVNAIITDPPYGIDYVASKVNLAVPAKNKTIANDDITNDDAYTAFSTRWIQVVLPYMAKKNSIYIFNCDKMLFALKRAMDACAVYFSQLIVWVKNQATLARKDYAPQHELILYGWYGTHLFHKAKDKSVMFYPKPSRSLIHPTIKPNLLISRIILNSTKIGGVVYDPFLGSGTTLIACQQTGRICCGAEIDIEYAQTIISRFENLTNSKAHLLYEKDES